MCPGRATRSALVTALSILFVASIVLAAPPPLIGVQGQDDQDMALFLWPNTTALTERYQCIKADISPGLRRYNAFWSALESGTQPASAYPMNCTAGFVLVPLNETDRVARGYNNYHCYSTGFIAQMDFFLELDAKIGAASAVITWSAPEWAINANCTGFPWTGGDLRQGCLPWGQLDNWSDFILFLAERWSAPLGTGARISGMVIWNEVQNLGWADPSPFLPNRYTGQLPILSPAQMQLYTSMLANLTLLAHAAASRHIPDITVWLSTDHTLTTPTSLRKGDVSELGLYEILDALWPQLPLSLPWSVAVHPYDVGDPRANLTTLGLYTFLTLNETVASYQCGKLVAAGVAPSACWSYPQTWMWASEQGWPLYAGWNPFRCCTRTEQARNICFAHGLALAQGLWAVTHNFFQGPYPTSQNGADFSLIDEPPVCPTSLVNCNSTSLTYQAYMATAPGVYGVTDGHYCCAQWGAGCAGDRRGVAELAATYTTDRKWTSADVLRGGRIFAQDRAL